MSENYLSADEAVKSYLSSSGVIIKTDNQAIAPSTHSFDPVMWGALFFTWVLIYIPRLIKALIKGADKYEASIFDGWWIVGIGVLFWGYNEKIAAEDVAGWLFLISIIFWLLWLSRHKLLNISRKSRIWVSSAIIWTLTTVTWIFGEDLWDAFINEEITAFLSTLLIPPLFIAALWQLYRWVNSAP